MTNRALFRILGAAAAVAAIVSFDAIFVADAGQAVVARTWARGAEALVVPLLWPLFERVDAAQRQLLRRNVLLGLLALMATSAPGPSLEHALPPLTLPAPVASFMWGWFWIVAPLLWLRTSTPSRAWSTGAAVAIAAQTTLASVVLADYGNRGLAMLLVFCGLFAVVAAFVRGFGPPLWWRRREGDARSRGHARVLGRTRLRSD